HRRSAHRSRQERAARRGLRTTAEVTVAFRALLVIALAVTLAFFALPILPIFVDVGVGELLESLGDPASLDALRLSLETTVIALVLIVVVGNTAADCLATRS